MFGTFADSYLSVNRSSLVLYQPYPSTWPLYTPRDKIADWLEQYTVSQDLVVWTNARPVPVPTYDHTRKKWTVVIDRGGNHVTLHPSHIVLATGTLGAPRMPENMKDSHIFTGTILHACSYNGGKSFAGKRVVVVGAGNTSADICQDLCFQGAQEITMLQRSTTCVVKSSTTRADLERIWPPGQATETSDFKFAALPLSLLKKMVKVNVEASWERERDIHEGLLKAGLRLNMGIDDSGLVLMVYERGGGYC